MRDGGREAAQVHDGCGHGPPLLGQHDGVQRDQAAGRQQLRMCKYVVRFRLFSSLGRRHGLPRPRSAR